MAGTLRLRQIRSSNGGSRKQHEALRSLGLGRIGSSTERPDGPALRGQLAVIGHLVELQED